MEWFPYDRDHLHERVKGEDVFKMYLNITMTMTG